jgi:NADPH:quinone reductase-like Zn-dependent oxidoreductase
LSLVGLLSGTMADRKLASDNERGIRVDSVYVGSVRHFQQLMEAIDRWSLHPVIDRVFPFSEATSAYEYLGRGEHVGKIVISL